MTLPPMGPNGRGQTGNKTKFSTNIRLHSHRKVPEKTKCMVLMFIKPSIWIVKLMASGSGVQALRRGQYGHMVKMYY